MENGRCRMHGGSTPKGADSPHFIHGIYSEYAPAAIRDKIEKFKAADPFDLFDELATQRALFAEYLSRFVPGMSLTVGDIHSLMQWSAEITKTVERITKLRNETALTAAEMGYFYARAVDVALKYFDDPNTQEQFLSDLFTFDKDSARKLPEIIAGTARD